MKPTTNNIIERPPVIAIMGHVDHGKSTLLDYIRKSNVVDSEAGGITQRISAYEVIHKAPDGKDHRITFLDTPGHEAFSAIRARGAQVADIAILVVAADDGVKPQTIEAIKVIKGSGIPYIVAINKIDKEGANVERIKSNLAEHDVMVESYGGNVPSVPISAKTGQGVSDLLDMMILVAQIGEFKGEPNATAEGVIIEANLDKKKGITATIIIKNGTLRTGMFVTAGSAFSPVRIMENFLGKNVKEATFSSPVRLIGWSELPQVGSRTKVFASKRDAETFLEELKLKQSTKSNSATDDASETAILPIVLKASEVGSLEALQHEIKKVQNEKLKVKIIQSGVGDITENDVKNASARPHTIILGFNVKIDNPAKASAEKVGVDIQVFDIIYKLSEWLQKTVEERTPKVRTEEPTGTAKVLKFFSKAKDRQVIGGRVEKGQLLLGAEVKILRRDFEIGRGKVRELQRFKNRADEIPEGQEFGAMIECKIDIAPGDRLESFKIVEK
jgi:translation initiation factor IF-2